MPSIEELRSRGNELFKSQSFEAAVEAYTQALDLNPEATVAAILFCNRAAAALKLDHYANAMEDASQALELNPDYHKAYYRRGCALLALSKGELALRDLQIVVQNHPQSRDARRKLNAARKIVQREAQLMALAHDPFDNEEHFKEVVPATFSGPRFSFPPTLDQITHCVDFMRDGDRPHWSSVYQLMYQTYQLLKEEPNVVRLDCPDDEPVHVFGDLHGQFFDAAHILERVYLTTDADSRMVFLGDYVDRGAWSIEILIILMMLKLRDPKRIILLRGNHETNLCSIFGFVNEVKDKYGEKMATIFRRWFWALPIGCLVKQRILCVHGGLPVDSFNLQCLSSFDRHRNPPDSGTMAQILWSDPCDAPGKTKSPRGIGFWQFGPDISRRWCDENNLRCIIRAHQAQQDGYSWTHEGRVLTVFSAPNYMDVQENKGAWATILNPTGQITISTFDWQEHPFVESGKYLPRQLGF